MNTDTIIIDRDTDVVVDREVLYSLLHYEACGKAHHDGIMERFYAERPSGYEASFDPEEYLIRFRELGIKLKEDRFIPLDLLYDMGWNQTDYMKRSKELLAENDLDPGRVKIPSPTARTIVCSVCGRTVYTCQEETYADWREVDLPDGMVDEVDIPFCHDCVPRDIYEQAVERAIRKGYARKPPPKTFS